MSKNKSKKKKKEFSKVLLIQESVLIWFISIALIGLAYICILNDYAGSLPWITAMVSLPWAAYGTSASFYYKKSQSENTKDGIRYETILKELDHELQESGLQNIDEDGYII